MKDLFISEELALRVTPALEEVAKAARRVRGVPPALQNLFFEVLQPSDSGPFHEAIRQFVAARRRTSQPVAALRWETKEGSMYAK